MKLDQNSSEGLVIWHPKKKSHQNITSRPSCRVRSLYDRGQASHGTMVVLCQEIARWWTKQPLRFAFWTWYVCLVAGEKKHISKSNLQKSSKTRFFADFYPMKNGSGTSPVMWTLVYKLAPVTNVRYFSVPCLPVREIGVISSPQLNAIINQL
jgi:hypothetical protein